MYPFSCTLARWVAYKELIENRVRSQAPYLKWQSLVNKNSEELVDAVIEVQGPNNFLTFNVSSKYRIMNE